MSNIRRQVPLRRRGDADTVTGVNLGFGWQCTESFEDRSGTNDLCPQNHGADVTHHEGGPLLGRRSLSLIDQPAAPTIAEVSQK